jgi:putative Ca2+/H+ antiporter (TMEM165/GDT1 family)
MDLAVILIAFAAIFVVELPDKTFIAALVLSTRYPPFMVWLGVGTAFLVQSVVAVTAGQLVTFLPDTVIKVIAAAIFMLGAVVLFRTAPKADAEEAEQEEEFAAKAGKPKSGLAAAVASFLVLFAAEWGDLSQLLTISLVAKYHEPVSVFLGAWLALLSVSALAVLAGRVLLQHLKLSTVHYAGVAVCLVLVAVSLYEIEK